MATVPYLYTFNPKVGTRVCWNYPGSDIMGLSMLLGSADVYKDNSKQLDEGLG